VLGWISVHSLPWGRLANLPRGEGIGCGMADILVYALVGELDRGVFVDAAQGQCTPGGESILKSLQSRWPNQWAWDKRRAIRFAPIVVIRVDSDMWCDA
jgi:hypothetical protein